MARPIKNYFDWYKHKKDMRNHRKIKALRSKFGNDGYASYAMTLELLTGTDNAKIPFNEMELLLLSGDFMIAESLLKDIFDMMFKLDLFQVVDGFLVCNSLNDELKTTTERRDRQRDGKVVIDVENRVIDVENRVIANDNPTDKIREDKNRNTPPISPSKADEENLPKKKSETPPSWEEQTMCYDVEALMAEDTHHFDSICMVANFAKHLAPFALNRCHLYLAKTAKYPMTKYAAKKYFQSWLKNVKPYELELITDEYNAKYEAEKKRLAAEKSAKEREEHAKQNTPEAIAEGGKIAREWLKGALQRIEDDKEKNRTDTSTTEAKRIAAIKVPKDLAEMRAITKAQIEAEKAQKKTA